MLRKFKPVKLCNNSANCADSSVRFLVCCGFARADSPNGFVCNGDARCLFGGNTVVKCLDLTCKECVGNSGFALFKGFTHANYGQNTVFKCGFCALVNGFIRLTEILSALTVTDNCVFDTYTFQHVCTYFARKRAFCRPVNVLRAQFNVAAFKNFCRTAKIDKRRTNDDIAFGIFNKGKQVGNKLLRLVAVLVHFPIAGD